MLPLISFETGRKNKLNLLFKTTRWSPDSKWLTGPDLLRLEVKEQNAIAHACGVVGFGSLEGHEAAICGDHWI